MTTPGAASKQANSNKSPPSAARPRDEAQNRAAEKNRLDQRNRHRYDDCGRLRPTVGKERYYQLECIRTIIEQYKAGKQKMLVHMATGLEENAHMAVALVKALLSSGLAKRIFVVVDQRMLAKRAVDDGFALINREYPSSWITSGNYQNRKHANIHVVVIDTLEGIFSNLSSELLRFAACGRMPPNINVNRKLIFDHFYRRVGLTATPRIAIPKDGADVDERKIWRFWIRTNCSAATPAGRYQFDLARGIEEGFLAPYKPIELISSLIAEAQNNGIAFDHVVDPHNDYVIDLGGEKRLKLEQLNRRYISERELRTHRQKNSKSIRNTAKKSTCSEQARIIA